MPSQNVNTLSAASLYLPARLGTVRAADLAPWPEGIAAFVLWRSLPRRALGGQLIVQRVNNAWLWCGGFAGMPLRSEGHIPVLILARRTGQEAIRYAMWKEAISPEGLQSKDIALWLDLVRRLLPDDLMRELLGARGLNASSAARLFGVTRQTMARYMQNHHA